MRNSLLRLSQDFRGLGMKTSFQIDNEALKDLLSAALGECRPSLRFIPYLGLTYVALRRSRILLSDDWRDDQDLVLTIRVCSIRQCFHIAQAA